jgi:hypothetical protein
LGQEAAKKPPFLFFSGLFIVGMEIALNNCESSQFLRNPLNVPELILQDVRWYFGKEGDN